MKFPALTGKNVRVTVDGVRTERTKLFGTGTTRVEPVGIADVHVPGVAVKPPGSGSVNSGCRSDLVTIDGRPISVRVRAAPRVRPTSPTGFR